MRTTRFAPSWAHASRSHCGTLPCASVACRIFYYLPEAVKQNTNCLTAAMVMRPCNSCLTTSSSTAYHHQSAREKYLVAATCFQTKRARGLSTWGNVTVKLLGLFCSKTIFLFCPSVYLALAIARSFLT